MSNRVVWLTVLLLALGISTDAVQADLIGYWPFHEGQGTQTADVTGNGNDGTFNGEVEWVPGYDGSAVRFDTAGERIVIGPLDPTAENNAMTLAAWIKWEGQDHSIEQQGIIGKRLGWDPGTNVKWYWQTNPAGDLLFRADSAEGGTGLWWGNGRIASYPNEWIHVALTWDNGTAVQYVNGEEVDSGDISFIDTADDTPVTIGCVDSTNNETFVGTIDEARIYSHALSAQEIQIAMLPGAGPKSATSPNPNDGASNVPQDVVLSWTAGEYADTHKVYFGTSFDDVNDATGAPGQTGTTFDPDGLLEFNKTYFWRVDEVNAPPDATVYKGAVWSFTVEPFAYPITNIAATASSSAPNQGPENTVNGSGLDASDQHSTTATDMWLSDAAGPQPTWIQYEFDKAYVLLEMWVWNSNQLIELSIGLGARDVTIEYSQDGEVWSPLDNVEFAQAPGDTGYAHNTTVDLQGVFAKYIRLTINSNWLDILDQYGLSEVRFFQIPVQATDPEPASGASDVALDVVLDWRTGREAVLHDVYFSSDEQAVIDGTAFLDRVSETSYQVGPLEYGKIYYWKVNEVNEAAATTSWEGDVWDFSTTEYMTVDDFESYSAENPIWESWLDGLGFGASGSPGFNPGNGTGSAVGDDTTPSFTEETIVHGGNQSMPLSYNNSKPGFANYSETEHTLDQTADWTTSGLTQFSLWFRGYPGSVGSFVEEPAGTYTMTGSGTDITGTADEFHFAYKMLNGAGSIVAKVESIDNTNEWAKAGVMIRETLEPESAHAMTFVTPAQGVVYEYRISTGAENAGAAGQQTGITAPYWVKIDRSIAGTFTASHSTNGTTWQPLGIPVNIQMSANVYIGLAVTAHDAALTCEAVFSNVTTSGSVSGQWTNQDIGILANDPEQMYVALADSAGTLGVVAHEDPGATQISTWTQWSIELTEFSDQGVNLAGIQKIMLGIGDRSNPVAGGSGKMFIDDIAVGNPVAAREAENLLVNGGFETGELDPWIGGGNVGSVMTVVDELVGVEIPEDPIEGDYCLHIVVEEKGENTWDSQLKYMNLVFEAGKVYTLSAYIKSDDEMQVRLNPQLSEDPWTSYGAQTFTTTNEWQEYHITTPPMTETVFPANLDFHFNYSVGELWIDDVKFYEGEPYSPPPSGAIMLGDFEGDFDGWWERDATLSLSTTGATVGAQAMQVDGPGDWHMNALLDLKPHRVALSQPGATITADVTAFDADMATTWMNVEMVINGQDNDDNGPNNNIGWQSLGSHAVTRDGQPQTLTWELPESLTTAISAVDDNISWFELVLVSNLDAASVTKFYIDNIQLVIPGP